MGRIRVYKDCPVNTVDATEDLSIIKSEADEIYDSGNSANIIQSIGLRSVKISLPFDEAVEAQFVIVEVDGVEVGYNVLQASRTSSPNVTEIFIVEEPVATCLQDVEIISASANRLSVSDDDTVFYTEMEPFKPSQRPNILGFTMDTRFGLTGNPSCYNLLETLTIPPAMYQAPESTPVNLPAAAANMYFGQYGGLTGMIGQATNFFKKVINGTPFTSVVKDVSSQAVQQVSVTMTPEPVYRKMVPTQLLLAGILSPGTSISTGTRWWLEADIPSVGTDPVLQDSSVINDLRSMGADNNISAYWSIPIPYIAGVTHTQYNALEETNYGGVSAISSSLYENTYQFQTSVQEPKNNKAKYAQCLSLTVFNPVSGASMTKQPWEIANPSQTPDTQLIEADYVIGADLRPDGSPLFTWKYRNGVSSVGIPESIEGGQWRQIPVNGEGVSGSYWQQRQLNIDKSRTLGGSIFTGLQSFAKSAMTGAAVGAAAGSVAPGAGTLIGAGVGAIASGAIDFIAHSIAQNDQQELLNAQGTVASAEINTSASNYLREIGYNAFYSYFTQWKEQDVMDFDRFLTKFGYNVGNKNITINDFYSRPSFNYVRCNDIILKSDKWSSYMLNLLQQKLKLGVRIWHEMPNEQAIADGNKN